jgi:hypothetical protein
MGFLLGKEATPSTPAADKLHLHCDTTTENLRSIDDTGTLREYGLNAGHAIVAATAGINNSETIVVGGLNNHRIYANQLKAGATFVVYLEGTCTASAGNVVTIRVRIGTAGTTADTAAFTFALAASAASGTNIPFSIMLTLTFRTVGATTTQAGALQLVNQGTTGISTTATQVVEATTSTIDSTVANWLSVTSVSAAATTTNTFKVAYIQQVKI